MHRRRGSRLWRLIAAMVLAAFLSGCTATNVVGVDATSDRIPVVRNCGTWIRSVRASDANTRRLVWAANVRGDEDASARHEVGTVIVGRLPDPSWVEITPLAIAPRPVDWAFEVGTSGRTERIVVADSDLQAGIVLRSGHAPVTTEDFRARTCSPGFGALGVAGVLLFIAFFGVWAGGLALWIVSLVQVARIPDVQYRAAGSDKTTWILVVVLTSFIGALIWQFGPRRRVVAARAFAPPPPGWYPTPTGPRWWNGYSWTDAGPPPPPPPP